MSHQDIEALLWDNDGVLVDTERLYFQANQDILNGLGIALDEEMFREHFLVANSGLLSVLELHGYPIAELEEIRARRNDRYTELLYTSDFFIPGVSEALERLHGRFRMAVVTSSLKPHFEIIHSRTGYLKYFELVVAHGDYVESKPHPAPYLKAMEHLGCAPKRCLVIEDSYRGLMAAKAAGLRCWVVPGPLTHASDFGAAERILSSIADILSALSLD